MPPRANCVGLRLPTAATTSPLQVTDNGTPRHSAERHFQVVVIDPPPEQPAAPPEPTFDEASTAYLVGTILNGETRELWLMVRTTGKLQKLSVGDTLRVGKVSGTVQRIGEKEADIRTDNGDLRIRVGQNLTEAKQLNDTAQQDAPAAEVSGS